MAGRASPPGDAGSGVAMIGCPRPTGALGGGRRRGFSHYYRATAGPRPYCPTSAQGSDLDRWRQPIDRQEVRGRWRPDRHWQTSCLLDGRRGVRPPRGTCG